MWTTIVILLLINAIVSMVYNAGFWDSVDYYINRKFPLHHLPHILQCTLCQCFWLSLLAVIIIGQFNLYTIALSLLNGHLTKIMIPLLKVLEEWGMKIISWIMPR